MRAKTIVLDASLLLLLVVGLTSRRYIGSHKRLQTYGIADFVRLKSMIDAAQRVLVTPNTLTEASNLVGHIGEPARTQIYRQFRMIAKLFEEQYVESRRAVEEREFLRLGLADAVQLGLAAQAHTLLTVDLDLYIAAIDRGFDAINFRHQSGV
jgi:hypothetical protein